MSRLSGASARRDRPPDPASPARSWRGAFPASLRSLRRLAAPLTARAGLAALACIALASFAAPAHAQTVHWTANITIGVLSTTHGVWPNRTPPVGSIDDTSFDYDGATYNVSHIRVSSGGLQILLTTAWSAAAIADLELQVGSSTFALSAATTNAAGTALNWNSAGLSWSNGDTITLKLVEKSTTTSTDATLSGLSLGTGVALTPTFAAGTTAYWAWVANSVSSVTVTATKNDANATVAITSDTDTSTPDTATLNLSPGANTVTVGVTAEDGTTETYTVTVVRAAAAPAADAGAIWTANLTAGQERSTGAFLDEYGYGISGLAARGESPAL